MTNKLRNGYTIFTLCAAILLGGSPLGATVDTGRLENGIAISQDAFISQQKEEGYWFSYAETNTFYSSLQILLYYYLGKEEEEKETIEGLCRYLVNTQSEDGSWPFYDGGYADPGLATLNYFALKLSGYQKEDPSLVMARSYILSHGGAESIYGMYQIILSLYDQFYYSLIPDFPLLPVLYIAPQLSWFRMTLVPLMVLFQEKAFFHPPEEAYITELFINQTEGRIIPPNGKLMTAINTVAEKARKELSADPLGVFTNVIYLNWLLARQNTTDGLFYDYMPNTFFPLLSLKALEDLVNNDEAIDKALQGLHSFQHHLPEGIYQPPADAAIPATFSSTLALVETNLSLENTTVKKGVDFLWSRQNNRYGDWALQMLIPAIPGGWGMTLNSESFPDTDDTASTLLVLKIAYGDNWEERWWDFTRGVSWLLAMQNPDGGWGTWDREAGFFTSAMKELMPTLVLNESVVDHTTRVLLTLGLFGYTENNSLPVAGAVRWIKAQRIEDGSWSGTWFIDYIYQTANVLGALSQVKAEMSAEFIQESLKYILEKQREDGGWGESPSSFSAGSYVPLGYSSPSQTALILFGLIQFLRGRDYDYIDQLKDPIESAITFILSSQKENGLWEDPTYIGAVFPEIQYLRYPIFQEAMILGVLGLYSQDRDFFLSTRPVR
jgi:squalene/oxidosqualene cyclase-like protein